MLSIPVSTTKKSDFEVFSLEPVSVKKNHQFSSQAIRDSKTNGEIRVDLNDHFLAELALVAAQDKDWT